MRSGAAGRRRAESQEGVPEEAATQSRVAAARGGSSGGHSGRGRSGVWREAGCLRPGGESPGWPARCTQTPYWARERRLGRSRSSWRGGGGGRSGGGGRRGEESPHGLRPPSAASAAAGTPRGPIPAARRSAEPQPRAAGPAGLAGFPPYFPVLRICSRISRRSKPISRPLGSARCARS